MFKSSGLIGACLLIFAAGQAWADCGPGVLGTERTVTLPRTFAAFGKAQHEAFPLQPGEVVLTFDDGPRRETTPLVLKALADQCVKATFMTVGQNLRLNPDLARQEAAEGHSVGIHSFTHAHLSALSPQDQMADLEQSERAYRDIFGGPPPPAYRFPFLEETSATMDVLKAQGMTVLSVDIGIDDWQPDDTSEILTERLVARLKAAGSGIILFHDANGPTAKALPALLEAIKENGFKIVHIEWAPS